jgi:hypothetical protein
VAALIRERLGVDCEVIPGGHGEFTVWAGDTVVARKDANGFPDDEQIVTAVETALRTGS